MEKRELTPEEVKAVLEDKTIPPYKKYFVLLEKVREKDKK